MDEGSTNAATVQPFVYDNTEINATIYTDESHAYKGPIGVQPETVKYSVGEWVNGMAHTNGPESFWRTFKRAYPGMYHLEQEALATLRSLFAGKHNVREMDS